MKCPCGCGKEIPNGCYWATEKCGKNARKHGLYMPRNNEWRQASRIIRKINLLKKGSK
jgi:hypothetical protein